MTSSLEAVLPRVRAASPFVASVCDQEPKRFARWRADGWFEKPWRPGAMTRIALRDLAGWAELDETLGALSELADASIEAALGFAQRQLQARHGVPRTGSGEEVRPFILGMGKLGGRELNFSSDVDLICGY